MKINSRSGVNLTELMVAISIIGILLVTSVPVFVKRNTTQRLQVATNMISNQLMLTRQKAIASKKRYKIEYNYNTNQFRILRQDSPGVWVLDPPDNEYTLPVGVYMSSTSTPSDGTIEIEPRGTVVLDDLPVIIKLRDKNNVVKSIKVSRSGMVQEFSHW